MKILPGTKRSSNPVAEVLEDRGISLDPVTISKIEQFLEELLSWSRKTDLTGIKDMESAAIIHLGDTLTLLPLLREGDLELMDLGTGPGVPGLILKLLVPHLRITLVDARRKRVSFLKYIISTLGIKGIRAVQATLPTRESLKEVPFGAYDLVVSRAVSDLLTMARTSRPYLKETGRFILMKGPKGLEEIERFQNVLEREGISLEVKEDRLPVTGARRIIIVGQLGKR